MPDLIGPPSVEVYSAYGGYVVVANVPVEPESEEWTNRKYVCLNINEVLAKVKYAIECSDAEDATSLNRAMKEKGKSGSSDDSRESEN